VWEDHLLSRLTGKEAGRLACTCSALRGVVREHFRGDIGTVKIDKLPAALTAFPRARALTLRADRKAKAGDEGERQALVEWLRGGGRGGHLERLYIWGDAASDFIHMALQAGALPSLKSAAVNLGKVSHRASLTGGSLRDVHELRLTVTCSRFNAEGAAQLAALGLVRQLPALTSLNLTVDGDIEGPVQWPPFIPPSLKTLDINVQSCGDPSDDKSGLLPALPGMLGASGAALERLEFEVSSDFETLGDVLVHMTQAVRCCSSTLQDLRLAAEDSLDADDDDDSEDSVDAPCVQWAELRAGLAACRELHRLALPMDTIEVEPLFPPGTVFARLTGTSRSATARESTRPMMMPVGWGCGS
jgi:hypothetical protein